MIDQECIFCGLANKLIFSNIIYEDKHTTCFLDNDPINLGHTLIVPKKHYIELEELDNKTLDSISRASVLISKMIKKYYKPDGISLMQNGGVFNDVGHYHMHVFPRYIEDGFGWTYPKGVDKSSTQLTITRDEIIEEIKSILEG